MSTRRLIAIAHEGGYDYVHLSYEGDTAADMLEANWSTASAARELIAGGDIAVLAVNDVERHNITGHGIGSASNLEDLLVSMLENEHLVSIFDASEGTRDAIEDWNGNLGEWNMMGVVIDNPDSSGSWIHLADMQAVQDREDIEEERAEHRKAA